MAAEAGTDTAVVALVISNLEFGGAQQQVVELANHLDPDRFDAHVISLSRFVPIAARLRLPAGRQHVVAKHWKYDVTVVTRLAALLRRLRADIAHGLLFDAEIACRLAASAARVPAIVGSERNCDYSRSRTQLLAYRLTRRLQTLCVANSNAGARFNSSLLGYPIDHYAVVHNGVNTGRFHPGDGTAVRERHGIGAGQFVIGVFGSFKAQKNHKLFFRAAGKLKKKYQNLTFLLVGDRLHGGMRGSDRYRDEVNELVDDLNIRPSCVFAGNQERVEEYYRACDITVLPSDHEGMPNVILESLASGVPVVATDVSDNSLLVPDGQVGFLVRRNDVGQLTDRIAALIDDRPLRETMAERARSWTEEQFSARRMAQKMAQVYESLL